MTNTISERIESRLSATGQTARAASLEAGLSDGFVRNILTGKSRSPRGENLAKLARQLRTTEIWILRGEGPEEIEAPAASRGRPAADVIPANVAVPDLAAMPRDLPVYGTASAAVVEVQGRLGKGEGFVLDRSRAVDFVRRPPALARAADAYAVYVAGDSMAPKHPAGDMVVVHPHKPVRPGDSVLVIVKAGEGLAEQAFLKTFRGRTEKSVLAEQINPKAVIDFKAATVVAVHKVLTTAELMEA